ncbi:efflux transporter outer membrane subunit [Novosphingobium sp. YJ-S2-02]|uniref:Efflux transporter outer membrane subunit n=1 Tax=Novosphingobium aureum TaxID=2792964 RepID=A0A931MLC2_9SPHN|nr:efflux transporter outer membrane subunit [Novosphingobium aureum]MBH0113872.1 efflux transporter outer membrane subunit [Novosphingobium aureum]
MVPRKLGACSALGALALALAGCSTAGPDYRPPEAAVANLPGAQGNFDSAEGDAFSQAPLPDHWWRLYDDPRLDALVEEALAANADLRVAEANLERAQAAVREAAGAEGLGVELGAQATAERNYSLRSAQTSLPGVITSQLGLSFNYPLDLKGKLKRGIEASIADREAVEAARDAVRISVAAATARAYASVCAANYQIATVEQVVSLQEKTLDATTRLQKGGRGTAFDVSRARTAVETSKASLPGFYARRKAGLYLLATLTGKPPADYPRQVADCSALPSLREAMPVGDGAAMIRRRPDIREAERRIAGDTARIGVQMADLYPSVSIAGGLMGFNQLRNLPKEESLSFGLGPLLSWNFPYRAEVRARIDGAEAQVKADIAQFDATVLEALRGTEEALDTYARDREQAQALGRAADSAATSASQAGKLFRYGRSDFLSLLDAQGALASARVSHAAAQAALIDDQISVFLALGGGWQQAGDTTSGEMPEVSSD